MSDNNKLYLEADVKIEKETAALREIASSIIDLPKEGEKQPDLLYFSAIFVSSGENLNHAYFLPSELISAEGSVVNKALDVEHKEEDIVGHIYERVFIDADGNEMNAEKVLASESSELDGKEIHIAIAGILYKSRFPEMAKEVKGGDWKVSMEAYYKDYDVKIGNLIVSKKEAEMLGLGPLKSDLFGKVAKALKNGKTVAEGAVTRVLRGILFSGCGFVKHPANPKSVVLETANVTKLEEKEVDKIVLCEGEEEDNQPNIESVSAKELKHENVDTNDQIDVVTDDTEKVEEEKEESELQYDDTVGVCVSFKRWVYADTDPKKPGSEVLHENWCTLYERPCTSFSRDTTDPNCLRNQIGRTAASLVEEYMDEYAKKDKRAAYYNKLVAVLDKANKR